MINYAWVEDWYPALADAEKEYSAILSLDEQLSALMKERLRLRRLGEDSSAIHESVLKLRKRLNARRVRFNRSTRRQFCDSGEWEQGRLQRHFRAACDDRAKRSRILDQQAVSWDKELDDFVWWELKDLAEKREAATGFKWQIDHLVPLCSEVASGLHYAHNWQLIPAYLNNVKLNRLIYSEPLEWMRDIPRLNAYLERKYAPLAS